MSVRLSKAIRELNIGLQTAVEFLEKKGNLGEVKNDLSFKLSEQQYEALVEEFKSDKDMRTRADKIFAKKTKEKKKEEPAEDHKAETVLERNRPQFKAVGKIDLDAIGGKSSEKKAQKQEKDAEVEAKQDKPTEAAAVSHKKTVDDVKAEAKPAEKKAEPKQEKPVENKQEHTPKAESETKEMKAEEKPQAASEEKKEVKPQAADDGKSDEKAGNKVFTLKSEHKLQPKVNVLGKIDLDSINQSTRPKKKSKEERKKEREEKAMQRSEKKKRERINKVRVDINDAANQQPKQNGGGGKNAQQVQQDGSKSSKKKNRKRNKKLLEVNEEDVARQVKETLARLTSKGQNKKGAKYRKEKREAAQERMMEERAERNAESKILKLTEFVTVSELATMMNVGVNQVIGTCMSVGIMVSINQRLDAETINLVADEFGFKTEYVSAEVQEAITEEVDDENDLLSRSPIVTVMGHVDHGKTSLLDYIRKTNVIAGEAGGITQHIGAYNVQLEDGRRITFLDTPGHEAFTAMRARGAQVTDIAIIIISADDSVMPTTKEAIAHAQAANVPMVFAINKIDKPGANPDKIREDLANMNLLVEEWGGKYQCQEISAKKGIGVQDLLEKVLLEAEMLDLKANPNRKATGSIIESSLDKGRGYVSTVLVANGTLKVGDNIIAGTSWGRIKAMFNERNQRIQEAGPAEPAIILGLNGAPTAGDSFHILDSVILFQLNQGK